MTSAFFEECVAIDTNVFEHLLNPQVNTESHISGLLQDLQRQEIALILDDKKRVSGEYENRITPAIRNADVMRAELPILRYWFLDAPRLEVPLDLRDQLMQTIKAVINESSESVDRILVYVAFKKGKTLITNDETHIVMGPPTEQAQAPRRARLLRRTKKIRAAGSCILTSKEAYTEINRCPTPPSIDSS